MYQRRFYAVVVESERQYYLAMRYVEGNVLRSGLVDRAERWPWSSLAERVGSSRGLLDDGPMPLPEGWRDLVNEPLPPDFLQEIRERFRWRPQPSD